MDSNPLHKRRILVIDDDSLFVEIVEHFLNDKEVQTEAAYDLAQAKALLCETHFDLILLDGFLPDGKGIDLIPHLNASKIDAPVLMVTADDDQASMQKYFIAGVSNYVIKPVNMELLWLKMQRSYKEYLLEQQMVLQNEMLERYLDEKNQEEELARHVYRHLAQSTTKVAKGIRCHMQASQVFNGDFFIAGKSPNGNDLMMLVDATGHGLAAAISVLPMVSAVRAMVQKGLGLAHIVHEINQKLHLEIPDDRFVAGIGIEVDHNRSEVYVFNAGMPDIYVVDDSCNVLNRIRSESLPLGILGEEDFSPAIKSFPLHKGQHLIAYSDGLTEQTSMLYESFGHSEFNATLERCHNAQTVLDDIVKAFNDHSASTSVEDDVSLCTVDLWRLHEEREIDIQHETACENGELDMNIKISGSMLKEANTVSFLDELMRNISVPTPLRQKAFTVFSELVNNGLDHGVMNLQSELKNDFEGFAQYLEEREARLQNLEPTDEIRVSLQYKQITQSLHFDIIDSGAGYVPDPQNFANKDNLSGRGVSLVQKLSDKVTVYEPGNRTSVVLKRDI